MFFWLRVLAIGKVALLAKDHLKLLEPSDRSRLAKLVAQSKGRPRSNLSPADREELLGLARKLEPAAFAKGAWGAARGRMSGKP
jgi:hypothetical protein